MHPDDRKNATCLAAHLSSGNWYDGLVSIRGVVLQLAPYQLIVSTFFQNTLLNQPARPNAVNNVIFALEVKLNEYFQ